MSLDRGPVEDAQLGLVTARERFVEAATGMDGAIEEMEQVRRGSVAP
jgi:hypothetical protein